MTETSRLFRPRSERFDIDIENLCSGKIRRRRPLRRGERLRRRARGRASCAVGGAKILAECLQRLL